jgi:hypothetical protein
MRRSRVDHSVDDRVDQDGPAQDPRQAGAARGAASAAAAARIVAANELDEFVASVRQPGKRRGKHRPQVGKRGQRR